jgi:hypothetical protein
LPFKKKTFEAIKEKMQNIFQLTESKDQANILVYHLW